MQSLNVAKKRFAAILSVLVIGQLVLLPSLLIAETNPATAEPARSSQPETQVPKAVNVTPGADPARAPEPTTKFMTPSAIRPTENTQEGTKPPASSQQSTRIDTYEVTDSSTGKVVFKQWNRWDPKTGDHVSITFDYKAGSYSATYYHAPKISGNLIYMGWVETIKFTKEPTLLYSGKNPVGVTGYNFKTGELTKISMPLDGGFSIRIVEK